MRQNDRNHRIQRFFTNLTIEEIQKPLVRISEKSSQPLIRYESCESLQLGVKKMQSLKTIIIGLIVIVGCVFLFSSLGFNLAALLWAIIIPALFVVIHLISAQALFSETKRRRARGRELFLNLDPLFWGLAGLAFGILGMVAFRLLNDHWTVERLD